MFAAKKTLRYNSFNVIVRECILVLAFAGKLVYRML